MDAVIMFGSICNHNVQVDVDDYTTYTAPLALLCCVLFHGCQEREWLKLKKQVINYVINIVIIVCTIGSL